MRIAVLSDIHGNLTAFEAVIADIHKQSPDLVLHGGDLADSGPSPREIVDRIRDLGWQGVLGNTDEMLFRPDALEAFASQSSAPPALWEKVREIAVATRAALGEERLNWLAQLPMAISLSGFALVHAMPASCWHSPPPHATAVEIEAVYGMLRREIVVFGHTHLPSIRTSSGTPRLLLNAGSVGMPLDGDPRASYLLLDAGVPAIRRVEYDRERELRVLASSSLPGVEWTARILRSAMPQTP